MHSMSARLRSTRRHHTNLEKNETQVPQGDWPLMSPPQQAAANHLLCCMWQASKCCSCILHACEVIDSDKLGHCESIQSTKSSHLFGPVQVEMELAAALQHKHIHQRHEASHAFNHLWSLGLVSCIDVHEAVKSAPKDHLQGLLHLPMHSALTRWQGCLLWRWRFRGWGLCGGGARLLLWRWGNIMRGSA